MKRDYKFFLIDIAEACKHIQEFTAEMELEQFLGDEKTSSAVVRKLEGGKKYFNIKRLYENAQDMTYNILII